MTHSVRPGPSSCLHCYATNNNQSSGRAASFPGKHLDVPQCILLTLVMIHLVTLALVSVFCETTSENIACIGLRDGQVMFVVVSTQASVVSELTASSAWVGCVPGTEMDSSHLISLTSKTNYKNN